MSMGGIGDAYAGPYPYPTQSHTSMTNEWINKIRQWQTEQEWTNPSDSINNALAGISNGSNDTTEQEELLQLSCDRSNEGPGWGHYRCSNRSWFRPIEKGEGKYSWSGHTREEDKGS